ncbi:MAG TPA: hypothetical protein GX507_03310, partial [Clostridia bacterium]|nr:hypothetical protein [Clostridia bacterium]
MTVCLDIDADFIFRPRTTGNPTVRQDPWISPEDFVRALRRSGLDWRNCRAAVFADHEQAYFVWRNQGIHLATLVHVDAHSDFYDSFPWLVHCGNFLRKAAEEGFLKKIVWVVPPWLYESGEWRKWDLPHLRLGGTKIRTSPVAARIGRTGDARLGGTKINTSPRFERPRAEDLPMNNMNKRT